MNPMPSNDGTLELIERGARRWATEHSSLVQTSPSGFTDALFDALRDQGWLPASAQELSEWSPSMLARVGRGLGGDAAAAFLPVLTHVVAGELLRQSTLFERAGLLATSPFWDFLREECPLTVECSHGRNSLRGKLSMVVHSDSAALLVVAARDREGNPAIAAVRVGADNVTLHEPHATLGLRGPIVRTVDFNSVTVDDLVCGDTAREIMESAALSLRWGAVGLLAGIVAKASAAAAEYAELRFQGGRRIAEHSAVGRLLQVAHGAARQFDGWLGGLDAQLINEAPLAEARAAALRATEAALQVFGGSGYICPSIAERCWRDARQAATLCSS